MKKLKTIEAVRERERVVTTNIGFICDAKKVVKNKYIDEIKKVEYCVKAIRKACIVHNTLSFCVI